MRQKIVIRVYMHCQKCKVKAFKIVSGMPGVDSVALVGEEKNELEVIGDGIDAAELVQKLRKKVAFAEFVSLGEAKNVEKDKSNPDDDDEGTSGGSISWLPPVALLLPPPPPCYRYDQPYNDDPAGCTIL